MYQIYIYMFRNYTIILCKMQVQYERLERFIGIIQSTNCISVDFFFIFTIAYLLYPTEIQPVEMIFPLLASILLSARYSTFLFSQLPLISTCNSLVLVLYCKFVPLFISHLSPIFIVVLSLSRSYHSFFYFICTIFFIFSLSSLLLRFSFRRNIFDSCVFPLLFSFASYFSLPLFSPPSFVTFSSFYFISFLSLFVSF